MKAMIWKEWRQNVRWIGQCFAVFLLLAMQCAYSALHDTAAQGHKELVIWLTLGVGFLAPFFAARLGWAQIKGELKRDQWAFLIHRPASRTQIFGGKLLAGVSMYLLATVTPILLLLLLLWMRVPPLDNLAYGGDVILRPLASVLASFPFYFAGMLVALRPVRWYGSRYLPLLTALSVGIFAGAWDAGWQNGTARLLLLTTLGLAAWACFLTDGNFERQPRLGKLSLGLTLYTGILAVLSIVGIVFMADDIWSSVKVDIKSAEANSRRTSEARQEFQVIRANTPELNWDEKSPDVVMAERAVPKVLRTDMNFEPRTPWYLGPIPTLLTPPTLATVIASDVQEKATRLSPADREIRQRDIRNFVASTFVVGFLLSLPTVLAARRSGLNKVQVGAWWIATVLLGLSGFLLLLCLHDWPHQEECSNCGRKRSVRNELCEHCGASFPSPTRDETSIFESSRSSAVPLQPNLI